MPVDLYQFSEKRDGKRFAIECPVTAKILVGKRYGRVERGKLVDIGKGGARVHLGRPLDVGARLVLHVHFSSSEGGTSTVRFGGIVIRTEPTQQIAVKFHTGGRFLRDEFDRLL